MRLSRIAITNFRNFKALDVQLWQHAVMLGENKVGKTNLLFALRLILDPALPNSMRRLRLDDFWDGLPRPLTLDDAIEISVEVQGFEKSENLLAVLADHLVKPDPMVARITYRYQTVADLKEAPRSEADYEFIIFGGGRPDNTVGYDLRRWMPLDLFPALRDAESDLARWSRSPLRPLLLLTTPQITCANSVFTIGGSQELPASAISTKCASFRYMSTRYSFIGPRTGIATSPAFRGAPFAFCRSR
jgi:putative ATP-dependent endonuclease of OLD family